MRNKTRKAVVGGLIGTIAMTLFMKFGAPFIAGYHFDIGGMISHVLGVERPIGMVAHLFIGLIVFPLIYTFFCYRLLPGPPASRGMLYGLGLWLVAATVVMPMAGAGFFMSAAGPEGAMASLLGHVIYGAVLGAVAGPGRS